jgi:acetylornithine deacetylase/succinyl-diaminopimelate desuccinylase-like protein
MEPWRDGLGPWQPVFEDGKLYGRGAADDGYSAFAAVSAIAALKAQGARCARCVLVVEACEESGSHDLPHYIEALAARIGTPDLVIGLDSGCGDYERLWMTTSLRGLVTGTLSVSTLHEGVHSGGGSGIVPSSFRIARRLLSRLEDEQTGEIRPRELYVEIPAARLEQAEATARVLGSTVHSEFPFQPGARPVTDDPVELLLNRCWRPQIEITGADGLPPLAHAGNVLRPRTALQISLRLPPTADAGAASKRVKELLCQDPPYGAAVSFKSGQGARGWNAPPTAPWLEASVERASREIYGQPACFMGEGGTIPFMAMLGERFPEAQFLITGVLGPHSNAHGPNEFLHVPYATKLTACVAQVLADHAVARLQACT